MKNRNFLFSLFRRGAKSRSLTLTPTLTHPYPPTRMHAPMQLGASNPPRTSRIASIFSFSTTSSLPFPSSTTADGSEKLVCGEARPVPLTCPAAGTQFTCFTGTKVQIPEEGTQFTCFTGTKVQIPESEEPASVVTRHCAAQPLAPAVSRLD